MNKTWGAEGVHKDRIVIAGTGLVVAALGITGWVLFGGTGSGDNKSSGFTHMHCSVCGEEIPYIAKLAGNSCAVCDSGGTYTPTVGSIKDETSAPSTGAKLVCFLLVALVLVQGQTYRACCGTSEALHDIDGGPQQAVDLPLPLLRAQSRLPGRQSRQWRTLPCTKRRLSLSLREEDEGKPSSNPLS